MADKLISQLGATAGVVGTDIFEIEKLAGPPSQKATITQLTTLLSTIYAPITGGAYVLKAGDTMTGLLQFSGTGHFGLRLNNLTTAQRDAIGVGSSGMAIWNTTTGRFDMNIGGSWKNFVRLDGDTMTGDLAVMANSYAAQFLCYGGTIWIGSTGLPITAGVFVQQNGDGILNLIPIGGFANMRLNLGGTSSAFPALKRSSAILQARLADDSAYTAFEASTLRTAIAYTVATLPAAGTAGRRAYVTDALTPAFLTIVVGGGAVITPVFDNGTNWIGG